MPEPFCARITYRAHMICAVLIPSVCCCDQWHSDVGVWLCQPPAHPHTSNHLSCSCHSARCHPAIHVHHPRLSIGCAGNSANPQAPGCTFRRRATSIVVIVSVQWMFTHHFQIAVHMHTRGNPAVLSQRLLIVINVHARFMRLHYIVSHMILSECTSHAWQVHPAHMCTMPPYKNFCTAITAPSNPVFFQALTFQQEGLPSEVHVALLLRPLSVTRIAEHRV